MPACNYLGQLPNILFSVREACKMAAYGDLVGSRAVQVCKPRQAWKGATVADE